MVAVEHETRPSDGVVLEQLMQVGVVFVDELHRHAVDHRRSDRRVGWMRRGSVPEGLSDARRLSHDLRKEIGQ